MSEEYPRTRRITLSSEIRGVLEKGRRVRASHLDARYLASPLRFGRVGLVVPKHGHTAVERNRLKRRLRELVRRELLPTLTNLDVIIRCSPAAYHESFDQLAASIVTIREALMEVAAGRRDP
ncbi:MAG: ribonuclease P protein component [Gemmatimonadota bacterium]|nr:ribonuclease P protein component [Gemmatimonadota bacterium]